MFAGFCLDFALHLQNRKPETGSDIAKGEVPRVLVVTAHTRHDSVTMPADGIFLCTTQTQTTTPLCVLQPLTKKKHRKVWERLRSSKYWSCGMISRCLVVVSFRLTKLFIHRQHLTDQSVISSRVPLWQPLRCHS